MATHHSDSTYDIDPSQPISTESGRISGYSRRVGDASDEVKQTVINTILQKADEYGLSVKDKANLIAFAKVESGFNPDALSYRNAAGVMQAVPGTAKDAYDRLDGSKKINGHHLPPWDPFDMNTNIDCGIAIYMDKKRRAHSDDAGDIYIRYNARAAEYSKHLKPLRADSKKFQEEISRTGGLKLESTIDPPHKQHPHQPAKRQGHSAADPAAYDQQPDSPAQKSAALLPTDPNDPFDQLYLASVTGNDQAFSRVAQTYMNSPEGQEFLQLGRDFNAQQLAEQQAREQADQQEQAHQQIRMSM